VKHFTLFGFFSLLWKGLKALIIQKVEEMENLIYGLDAGIIDNGLGGS